MSYIFYVGQINYYILIIGQLMLFKLQYKIVKFSLIDNLKQYRVIDNMCNSFRLKRTDSKVHCLYCLCHYILVLSKLRVTKLQLSFRRNTIWNIHCELLSYFIPHRYEEICLLYWIVTMTRLRCVIGRFTRIRYFSNYNA